MDSSITNDATTMKTSPGTMKVSKKGGSTLATMAQLALLAGITCAAPLIPDEAMGGFYAGGGAAAVVAASAISSRISEDEEEVENKIRLVARKPQEGKTFICISNITDDKSRNIHIVLTMNTLASGMQFFGRMQEDIGSKRIIVFNSKKSTAGGCLHAKNVGEIMVLLRTHQDVKVIVCCAHEKRIRESIPDLFGQAADSKSFENRKFAIHIDEAHKYIPENRAHVVGFNASPTVFKITGYSGTPKKIWVKIQSDPLFYKIHIINVEEEHKIIKSPEYRGVKHCEITIHDDSESREAIASKAELVDPVIPPVVIERAQTNSVSPAARIWYGAKYCFEIGNERLYLGFLNFILPKLRIAHDAFSYNFVPAYLRKSTQYQTIEMILQEYPTANVIVINGNGKELYRSRSIGTTTWITSEEQIMQLAKSENEKSKLLEPSYMIQKMIEPFPNCPTFVTGYTCVGMSVTLINETIGNFDNVVMAHQHLNEDKLYQLCRFLFNPVSWSQAGKARIKKTRFHSMTKSVIEMCLKYEEYVTRLSDDFAGKCPSLREIDGSEPELPTEREKRKEALDSIRPTNKLWTQFKVYDGNDEEMWAKADQYYKNVLGKEMKGIANPRNKKDENGFYQCSTTTELKTQRNDTIKNLTSQSWHSTFSSLYPNRTDYARVFVGYDNLDDNTEYTIYIKAARLERTEHTLAVLAEYGKKKSPKVGGGSGSDGSADDDSTDDEE